MPEIGEEEEEDRGGVAVRTPVRVSQGGRNSCNWLEVAKTEVIG